MDLIKVGICLDDIHFAHALSIGLARSCRNMTFTLLGGIDEYDGFDLILTSDVSTHPKEIMMVRDMAEVNIFGDPPFCVYRYKESQHLINDLLFIYFRLSGKNLEYIGDAECKILAFASASGGCGCTLTALSVGQLLYKMYGCKCLYLNLCPVDDSKKYLPTESGDSLLNLLYYLEVQRDFPLGSFISQTETMDYIHTNLINSYFDELSLTLLQRLLKKVDEIGIYSFLLVDMSNHFSRNNKQLLAQASQIVLLYQDRDCLSQVYFSRLVDELNKISQPNPMIMVKNFTENYVDEEDEVFYLSSESENPSIGDNGLINLQSFGQIQHEAECLAVKIIEGNQDD